MSEVRSSPPNRCVRSRPRVPGSRFDCSSACRRREAPQLDDTATIIFSSGSTGDPKGVVLSHFNIGSNIEAIAQVYRVLPNDRLMGFLPFFHSFGYTMFWFAASTGMGMICHPSPLDAALIGSLVERFRGTVLMATPTFLQLYMRRCTPAQFGSLRLVLVGAEKLPESLSSGIRRRLRHPAHGRLRPDRMLAGRRREHFRLARARIFSTRLSPWVCRPALARRLGEHRRPTTLLSRWTRPARSGPGEGAKRDVRLSRP